MHIGIIVHSQTGNTLSVAQKLQKKLTAAGHSVELEHLKALGDARPQVPIVAFESIPEVEPYDAIVFGSPVQAFSLSQGMTNCLKQIGSLSGKAVACLVTEWFPFPWLGGNRAVRQMTALVQAKGGTLCGSGIINWTKKQREQQIADVVRGISGMF